MAAAFKSFVRGPSDIIWARAKMATDDENDDASPGSDDPSLSLSLSQDSQTPFSFPPLLGLQLSHTPVPCFIPAGVSDHLGPPRRPARYFLHSSQIATDFAESLHMQDRTKVCSRLQSAPVGLPRRCKRAGTTAGSARSEARGLQGSLGSRDVTGSPSLPTGITLTPAPAPGRIQAKVLPQGG